MPDYAALAEQLDVSPSTLRRRFVDATGTSPHRYLVQCRAAAARLGFADVYFFSRQFRQPVGVPPAAYRRSRQG